MSVPAFNHDFNAELIKRKLSKEDLYLLLLRQTLINQAVILTSIEASHEANNTRTLVARLEQFVLEGE